MQQQAVKMQTEVKTKMIQKQRQAALESQMKALYELEYREDILAYMYEMENTTMASVELIDVQPELAWYMRPYLVDFLIEIHQQYRLRPETLYLAVNIVDRYVSKRIVYKKHYQLVGCAALWIASKFEDAKDRVPTVEDLCAVCCAAYDQSAFIQMEGHVLSTIGWCLGHPTAEAWLRLACCESPMTPMEDERTQHVARFVMEITLFHRAFVSIKPSDIAKACLMLARQMCATEQAPGHSSDRSEVVKIAQMLDAHLAEHLEQVSATVVKKYAPAFYSRASSYVREWYLIGRRFTYPTFPSGDHPTSDAPEINMVNSSPCSASSSQHGADSSDDAIFEDESEYNISSEPITPTTSVSGYSDRSDPFDQQLHAAQVVVQPPMPAVHRQTCYPPRQQTICAHNAQIKEAQRLQHLHCQQHQLYQAQLRVQHHQQNVQTTSSVNWQMQVIPPPAETYH